MKRTFKRHTLFLKKNIPFASSVRRRNLIIEAILVWLAIAAALWLVLGH